MIRYLDPLGPLNTHIRALGPIMPFSSETSSLNLNSINPVDGEPLGHPML